MTSLSKKDFEARAAIRYAIRRFLRTSEQNARAAGITPQQYQLLLVIKGMEDRNWATISEIAERLQILHHAAVGLCTRAAQTELVVRTPHTEDRRQVCVRLTDKGEDLLSKVAMENQLELDHMRKEIMKGTIPSPISSKIK